MVFLFGLNLLHQQMTAQYAFFCGSSTKKAEFCLVTKESCLNRGKMQYIMLMNVITWMTWELNLRWSLSTTITGLNDRELCGLCIGVYGVGGNKQLLMKGRVTKAFECDVLIVLNLNLLKKICLLISLQTYLRWQWKQQLEGTFSVAFTTMVWLIKWNQDIPFFSKYWVHVIHNLVRSTAFHVSNDFLWSFYKIYYS